MKEPFRNEYYIFIINIVYSSLIIISLFTLFGYSLMQSINYGVFSKQTLLILYPTIILIFHTIAVKVSREDMLEKENSTEVSTEVQKQ